MLTVKNSKIVFYGNRGMILEDDINLTNEYYKEKEIALIYKKPTPIKVIRVNESKTRIMDGFYEQKSTLDYSGIYKERYIEFDAKETNNKTSFPLSNIHSHQIEHIRNVTKFHGIAFLIVRFNIQNETYILMGQDLLDFVDNNTRKSIPYDYFKNNCKLIKLKFRPRLDYLDMIDIL